MKELIAIVTTILGSGLLSVQQFLSSRKQSKIKDYKTFLAELETMHEKLLEAKEVIMNLSVENEQQKKLIDTLNARIDEMENIITKYEKANA